MNASRDKDPRTTRGMLLVAAGALLVAAGWLTALFLVDVTDKRNETIISLSLKVFSTVAGVAISAAGAIIRKRGASGGDGGSPVRDTADRGTQRVLTAETLGERESLALYLAYCRRVLDEARKASEFVPLRTAVEPAPAAMLPGLALPAGGTVPGRDAQQQELIDLDDIAGRFRRVTLLGEPGSGKSTLVMELARRALDRAASDPDGAASPLPLYVSLSGWRDKHQSARSYLQEAVEERLGPGNLFARDFENQLARGRFLLLLDGLNEMPGRRVSAGEGPQQAGMDVPGLPRRHAGAGIDPRERSLRELADATALGSFIVTCRAHDYFPSLEWQVVRVLPMDDAQVDQFIETRLDPAAAGRLRQELAGQPTLAAVAGNPFFLASLLVAYRPGVRVNNRGLILDQLIATLLERERQRDGGDDDGDLDFDESTVTATVGRTAYRMLRHNQFGERSPIPRDDRQRELFAFLTGTGLLVERDQQVYFRHQLVQEYFAAAALAGRAVRRRPATLLADKRWVEVVGLWRDLDNRLDKRLVRCLRCRNLPWRRPWSRSTAGQGTYSLLTSWLLAVTATWAVLDAVMWDVHTLALPVRLPASVLLIAAALAVLRVPWFWLMPHRRIIINTAYVLGRTGYAAAVPRMLRAAAGLWAAERTQVAQSVARFGVELLPQILEGLHDRRWRVRDGSVQALGALAARFPDDPAVRDALIEASAAEDPRLTRSLISALGTSPHREVREALTEVVARAAAGSKLALEYRLQQLNTLADVGPLEAAGDDFTRRVEDLIAPGQATPARVAVLRLIALVRMPGVVEKLSAIARDGSEEVMVRQRAATALALTGCAGVAAMLELAAEPPLKSAVLRAVDQLRGDDAVPALTGALGSSDWAVRQVSVRALGRLARADAVPPVTTLAADPDDDVRAEVANALAVAAHASAVPWLFRLAGDRSREVRLAALEALDEGYSDLAEDGLVELALDTTYKDRARVIEALATYETPPVEDALRTLTGDADKRVARAAENALDQVYRRRHRTVRSWLRHPYAGACAGLRRIFELDTVQAMLREERLAGTVTGQRVVKVVGRIGADAELSRRCRHFIWLYNVALFVIFLCVGVVVLALLRLCLTASALMLDHWVAVGLLLLAALLSVLPGIRDLRAARVLGPAVAATRGLAVAVMAVALVGAVMYVWWPLVAALVAGSVALWAHYVWISAKRAQWAAHAPAQGRRPLATMGA
jgi:hypothetical protein